MPTDKLLNYTPASALLQEITGAGWPSQMGVSIQGFDADELDTFDESFSEMVFALSEDGQVPYFSDSDKKYTLFYAMAYKNFLPNTKFGGLDPADTEFGMRLPIADDLLPTGTTEWDTTWGTAGIRSWIGTTAPDAGTLAAAEHIVLTDAANDKWGFLFLGATDFAISQNVKQIYIYKNRKPIGQQNVEFGFRGGSIPISHFHNAYWFAPDMPFKIGVEIRTTGRSCAFPLGVVFVSSRRIQDETPSRPTAV